MDFNKIKGATLYAAIDESNHGHSKGRPEVYVLALSKFKTDALYSPGLPKVRNHFTLSKNFDGRDYSYLLSFKEDLKRIPQRDFSGFVTSSLLLDKVNPDLEKVVIFIDGEVTKFQRFHTRDLVAEVCGISKVQIEVNCGAKLDQHYPIVNLADQMANYIFRNGSLKKSSKDPRQKYFIR